MKKLISILLGFILMSGSVAVLDLAKPQVAKAITPREIIGVGVDTSGSVIPACSTFGYSINTFVNTGFGGHTGNGLVVDDLNNRLYALIVTAGLADPRVLVYDLDLAFINSIDVSTDTPTDISSGSFGRGNSVVNSSGRLMQFFERTTTAQPPACSGSLRCVGLRIFNGNFQELDTQFTGQNSTGLLVCTFEDSNAQTYCFRGTTAGGNPRVITAYNEAGATVSTVVGTAPNSGENTPITSDSTNIYGLRTATSALWSMTRAAGVVAETAALSVGANEFGMLVDAGATIIDGDDGTDIVIAMDNNVSTPTNIIRVDKTSFTEVQTLTLLAADAGTSSKQQNGLFFDDVNVTIHSTRESGATNMFRRIGFSPALSLQNILLRGTCTATVTASTCNPSALLGVDYSRTNAALYMITSELSPRIIKVDVCATGGP